MGKADIQLAAVNTIAGYVEYQKLQEAIWGEDNQVIVPLTMLIALARNGGLTLSARVDGVMAGILLGIPAIHENKQAHLSHMLGVAPRYRGLGLGKALKWLQHDLVMEQGIGKIVWTFDPLQAINAHLNIHELGAVVNTYFRDYYGAMDDELNGMLESDRFLVDWDLAAPTVAERRQGQFRAYSTRDLMQCIRVEEYHGMRRAVDFVLPIWENAALVEVPTSIQAIKNADLAVAKAWRDITRTVFEALFAQGFTATDVIVENERFYYYLERGKASF